MTPTYANKKGVRYRYYVSHALLQGRKADAGSVSRFSAPDVEKLVIDAMRRECAVDPQSSHRDAVDRRLVRAVVGADAITVELRSGEDLQTLEEEPRTLQIPFAPTGPSRKGVAHEPAAPDGLDAENRTALLTAIARSRTWIETILNDPSQTFQAIAEREQLAERHVRFLAPLAFLLPRIVQAIVDGRALSGLTVSGLARNLPTTWAEQEKAVKRV